MAVAVKVAEAFRTRLGLGEWRKVEYVGHGSCHPSAGHMFIFFAKSYSEELKQRGIESLQLVVTVPLSVYADVTLEEGLEIAIYPDHATVFVDTKPYGHYVHKHLSESEIAEMRHECEPCRLVMEAVGEADRQLKAEAETQKEDAK
jgi:hypothetical protein